MAAKEGYNLDQKPDESLEKYYRRLAKTADQRLVRLEKASQEKYFHVATQWAYAKAMRDIKKWQPKSEWVKVEGAENVFGLGDILKNAAVREVPANKKLRFNTKPPEGEDLIAKINDIKSFLSSPTSTKAGIINVYKKRADTVNKKYGTNFTWKQLAKYYESGQAKLWDDKFGSKTALRTIGKIQKDKKNIIKAIKEADRKDVRINQKDKDVLSRTVKMALKDNNLNIEDLL